jgi:putative endonuclease
LSRGSRPVDRRQSLALRGEAAAERSLRRCGMRILARRYRRRFGEIDLIGAIGDSVVFVEVKTRSGSGLGRPAQAVTTLKRRSLARVALAFLQERGWLTRPSRFDVVEVIVGSDEELTLRHIVDAFRLWPNG